MADVFSNGQTSEYSQSWFVRSCPAKEGIEGQLASFVPKGTQTQRMELKKNYPVDRHHEYPDTVHL